MLQRVCMQLHPSSRNFRIPYSMLHNDSPTRGVSKGKIKPWLCLRHIFSLSSICSYLSILIDKMLINSDFQSTTRSLCNTHTISWLHPIKAVIGKSIWNVMPTTFLYLFLQGIFMSVIFLKVPQNSHITISLVSIQGIQLFRSLDWKWNTICTESGIMKWQNQETSNVPNEYEA